ncbi:CHAT domain-containing protein [Micromonospora sp. KC213]|uniref:CHAT domain-containing protein n=1 Tax=Micromonospora sp. KC213 TaxID=2530378 RepID=UPI001404E180|nr:CHAT domain-containing protein [Micromonospora sp. KC213]
MIAANRRVVLLEYVSVADRIAVFGVRADWEQPQVVVLDVDRLDLSLFVAANFDSHRSVRDLADMPELWHAYDLLVQPLASWSDPGDIICLVPYGPLHSLPLHALRVGEAYLIERNPVTYVPSVSALQHSLTARPGAALEAPRRTAFFGDSQRNLPHAAAEAAMLGDLFGVEAYLGEKVTRQSVGQALATVDVVHIAGHARFDPVDPLESGLQLAGGDVLTASDIFGMPRVQASLVTLSGCETGVSHYQPGDELIGLTRAFLYARAASVLVSLWSVADDSTSFFMRRFYEHLMHTPGVAKVDALQAAILDTMEVPTWRSLHHWAPFVMVGDWR